MARTLVSTQKQSNVQHDRMCAYSIFVHTHTDKGMYFIYKEKHNCLVLYFLESFCLFLHEFLSVKLKEERSKIHHPHFKIFMCRFYSNEANVTAVRSATVNFIIRIYRLSGKNVDKIIKEIFIQN